MCGGGGGGGGVRVGIESCVQWNPVYDWNEAEVEPGPPAEQTKTEQEDN